MYFIGVFGFSVENLITYHGVLSHYCIYKAVINRCIRWELNSWVMSFLILCVFLFSFVAVACMEDTNP
jgi:hypothetical protein